MENLKNVFKTKVGSFIAVVFVLAYLGLYYFKNIVELPMDTLNNIILFIVGYYFGSADTNQKEKKVE